LKLAICNEMFEGWEIERVCSFVAEVGYEGLELAPFSLHEDVRAMPTGMRRRVGRALADTGLACAGLHWLLTKPEGLHIGTSDESVRGETTEYIVALAEFCAELGGRDMVFGSPRSRDVPPGEDAGDYWHRSVDSIRQAAESLPALGVVIGMEPLAHSISNFLNTAEEVRRFVAEVDHPNVGLTLDCYSMGDEVIPRSRIIAETGPLCAHVHANDTTKREPGTGDLDFDEVVRALRGIGYDGWVSLEVFVVEPDPETIARRGHAVMAEAIGRLTAAG
jgi:sugar phosphate isomerase/epimerase